MDTRTRQSLKDRDRANPFYIAELEGHQNPFLAATLPHLETVMMFLLSGMIGIGLIFFGSVRIGTGVTIISAILLMLALFVRITDPAKKHKH